jgi:hypothetical protein
MKKYFIYYLFTFALLCGTGCDDFLDVVPDDRVELDSDDKLNKLLIGSYVARVPNIWLEMMSDNADHKTDPVTLTYYQLWQEEAYLWKDIKDQTQNDAPKNFWEQSYLSIANANQVLASIANQADSAKYDARKAEALLIRAYSHFMLVNVYGMHYKESTAENDMGIVYMEKPETELNPHYERESVAEVYRKLDRDIEEALPLVSDESYTYQVYRFNRKAALAFAVRFNLFYGKYDKVIRYADELFGNDPTTLMRDKASFLSLTRNIEIFGDKFTDVDEKANFLLLTPVSTHTVLLNFTTGKLYGYSYFIVQNEGIRSPGPWGAYQTSVPYTFNIHSSGYSASNYMCMPVIRQKFRVTNEVTGTGHYRTSVLAFWAEESLLCRAEAYIATGQFDKAAADLDLWMKYQVHANHYKPLTREVINNYYGNLAYYESDKPTAKKELHPLNFEFDGNGSEQDNFLQCVLHFRRIETTHLGLRWFDIKRMGIVIYRRNIGRTTGSDIFQETTDILKLDDPRRAVQIPPEVISAGMTPTPRSDVK